MVELRPARDVLPRRDDYFVGRILLAKRLGEANVRRLAPRETMQSRVPQSLSETLAEAPIVAIVVYG